MKILFAGAYVPYPLTSGGRIRSYHLLHELARRHEVHFVALVEPDPCPEREEVRFDHHEPDADAQPLRELCATIQTAPAPPRPGGLMGRVWRLCVRPDDVVLSRTSGRLESLLRSRLSEQHFDLLFLDDLGAERYLRLPGRPPTVLSKHNSEGRLLDQLAALKRDARAAYAFARWEARVTRQREAKSVALANGVIVPSDADRRDLLADAFDGPISVVPNGVDTRYFRPQPRSAGDGPTLLFCGALFWYPNVDAITWFCREILPRVRSQVPDCRLRIVGNGPPAAGRALAGLPGVDWVGFIDDVRPHLAAATLCVVPLRAGSGSRLKILEALAAGRAVVATRVGAEGLDLTPDRDLCVADGAEPFARAVVELLSDPSQRSALEQAGRATVTAHYDWSQALAGLDGICTDAAGRRGRS